MSSKRIWQIAIIVFLGYGVYRGVTGHIQMSRLAHDLRFGTLRESQAAAKELMARDRLFDIMQEMPRLDRMRIVRKVIRATPGEMTVKQCLILLKDPRVTVRNRVAAALVDLGRNHIDLLVPALKDSDENVRKGVGNALVAIGKPVIPKVRDAVKDPDLRAAACDVLVRIGPPSVPAFAMLLKDKDQDVRMAAAASLGKIKSFESTPYLLAATRDIPAVRRIAVSSLCNVGDPRGLSLYIEVLGNVEDDGEVRARAARALSVIGGEPSIGALVKAMADYDLKVRTSVITGLQRIGAPAVGAVVAAMGAKTSDVRYSGAAVLEKIDSPSAAQALLKLAADPDPRIRLSAARGLGEQKISPQTAALVRLLGDSDGRVADAAADSLILGGARSVPELISVLGSGASNVVKYRAASALARIGPSAARPLLQAANTGGPAAKWAVYALGQARDSDARMALRILAESADPDMRWTAARALQRM